MTRFLHLTPLLIFVSKLAVIFIQNSNRKVAVFYFADEYRFRTEQIKINKTFLLSDMI